MPWDLWQLYINVNWIQGTILVYVKNDHHDWLLDPYLQADLWSHFFGLVDQIW